MYVLREPDRLPSVVLLQIMLNRHPPQARLRVDGDFGAQTARAVSAWQSHHRDAPSGAIAGEQWQRVMSLMRCQTLNHTDLDDALVALGESRDALVREIRAGHLYGFIAHDELRRAGAAGGVRMAGMSGGVGSLMQQILSASERAPIGVLRIFGHGNRGLQIVSAGHGVTGGSAAHGSALTISSARLLRRELQSIRPAFAAFGSAELHGCNVAGDRTGRQLLRDLADAWEVPVSAGAHRQRTGRGATFRFEGSVHTACPGGVSLPAWGEQVESQFAYSG